MSTYVKTDSACGRSFGMVDIFDLPLNPYGVRCCGECESIIMSREAWMDNDGNFIPDAPHITRLSRTPDNDPWYVR